MQPKIIRSLLLALGLLAGAATGHAQFNQSADVDRFTDLGNGLVRHVFGTLGHTGTFIRVQSHDRSLATCA